MAATRRNDRNATPLLPPEAVAFLRRRLFELIGLALLALGLALALALAAYDPADPSLNTATDRAPRNLLGLPGAYAADLLLQTLGLGAGLIVLVLAAWGVRLTAHRPLTAPALRVALMPAGVLVACAALSGLAVPASWPLAAPLGGTAGALVLGVIADGVRLSGAGLGADGLAALLWLPAVLLMIGAMGLGMGDLITAVRAPVRGLRGLRRLPAIGAALVPRRRVEEPVPILDALPEGPGIPQDPPAPKVEKRRRRIRPGKRAEAEAQPTLPLEPAPRTGDDGFILPPLDLLAAPAADGPEGPDASELAGQADMLLSVLRDFGVKGDIGKVRPGPVVTLFELEPAPGTKTSRVVGLADDIARSMSALSARIAVVPGRNAIGIELPNPEREMVSLRELLASRDLETAGAKLPLVLGKDIGGTPQIADLARMPHLLIAGTTGSGKSVAINTMLLSLLYSLPPEQLRLVLIDPKMLELSVYDGIPHLLSPVVTDPKKAAAALKWAVREMEDRYRAMSNMGVRNIQGYNARLADARRKGEVLTRKVQTGFDSETGKPVIEDQPMDMTPLPYIVVVVDEMADLMLVAGKEVEAAIQRLAQMARAAGIHIVMATQRPSVDVITGTIKANFPARISFRVASRIDSRTILGDQGAEQLLGQGDMLYLGGGGRLQRVHGPFVSDEEVETVVAHLRDQGEPDYLEAVTEDTSEEAGDPATDEGGGSGDDLYDQAVRIVTREGKASTSFIQRRLQIGYNRAARLVERMEAEGVVSPANHAGKRTVLAGAAPGDDS